MSDCTGRLISVAISDWWRPGTQCGLYPLKEVAGVGRRLHVMSRLQRLATSTKLFNSRVQIVAGGMVADQPLVRLLAGRFDCQGTLRYARRQRIIAARNGCPKQLHQALDCCASQAAPMRAEPFPEWLEVGIRIDPLEKITLIKHCRIGKPMRGESRSESDDIDVELVIA